MNRLIVGDGECSIRQITACVEKSSSAAVLVDGWTSLSRGLDTPKYKEKLLEKDLLLKRKEPMDVFEDLLEDWKSRQAKKAKLITFVNVLEQHCGWNDIGETIWETFHGNIDINTKWNDLDQKTQQIILNQEVNFLGKQECLESCLQLVDDNARKKILNEKLTGMVLKEFLTYKEISLAKNPILKIPKYYIPRQLIFRFRLDPKVFQAKVKDMFVVEDIDLRELYNLAKSERVDRSSVQKRYVRARFILLEFPEDFERIVKIVKDTSIHWIKKKGDKYFWKKTHGSLGVIHENISSQQQTVSEVELLNQVEKETTGPICFADGPGMGKSLLLASLCQIKIKNDKLSLFIVFTALLEKFEAPLTQGLDESKIQILQAIVDLLGEHAIGKEILTEMLKSETRPISLFLDGFDEVPPGKLEQATILLKCLAKDFKNVRVYCSTRLHRQQKLEEILGTLSFHISPFGYSEQCLFLETFWFHEFNISKNKNLSKFADTLIQTVEKNVKSKELKIIGIPLQCAILGEIYADDARKHANTNVLMFGISVDVVSIYDMYKALHKLRFTNLGNEQEEKSIKLVHCLAAIDLIFPDVRDKYKSVVSDYHVDLEKVNRLGFMFTDLNQRNTNFEFVHRTYAEYFVSGFLVDCLFGYLTISEELLILLLNESFKGVTIDDDVLFNTFGFYPNDILETIQSCKEAERLSRGWRNVAMELGLNSKNISMAHAYTTESIETDSAWEFCHPIYSILREWTNRFTTTPKYSHLIMAMKSLGFTETAETLQQKCEGFYNHSFQNVNVVFFVDSRLQDTTSSTSLSSSIPINGDLIKLEQLHACAYHDFFEAFKFLARFIKQNKKFKKTSDTWLLLLVTAIKHCSLNLVENCVMLLQQMQERPISELQDEDKITPCHYAARRGDYMIFRYLLNQVGFNLSKLPDLLHYCVEDSIYDTDEVIAQKLDIIADILSDCKEQLEHEVPETGGPAVVVSGLHFKLLKYLLDMGAHPLVVNRLNQSTVAHKAAEIYSPEEFHQISKFLIEKQHSRIFSMNNNNHETPFQVALQNFPVLPETVVLLCKDARKVSRINPLFNKYLESAIIGSQPLEILKLITKFGANPNQRQADVQQALLAATKYGNVTALQYLASLGCNINTRDDTGKTPLHLAFVYGVQNIHNTVTTLLELGSVVNSNDREGRTAVWYAENVQDSWRIDQQTIQLVRQALLQAENEEYTIMPFYENLETKSRLLTFVAQAQLPADMDTKILIDINATDKHGRNVLHLTTVRGNFQALKYFLEHGGDISKMDEWGETPLHRVSALEQNFMETLNVLLEHGADINAPTASGANLLFVATFLRRTEQELCHLVQLGADINVTGKSGEGIFHAAAAGGNYKAISYFVSLGLDINACCENGQTPLHKIVMAETNFWETLQALKDCGADVNATDEDGDNLLILAAFDGRSESELRQIMHLGVTWKVENVYGKNILHLAAEGGNHHAINMFAKLGANVNARDNDDMVPLFYAVHCEENFLETFSALVANGADINSRDKAGKNILVEALHAERDVEDLEQIVKLDADWTVKTNKGSSLLHIATSMGNFKAVRYFLSLGLNIHATNIYGETPIHQLKHTKHNFMETLDVLLENKANVNAIDSDGFSLLLWCAQNGHSVENLKLIISRGGNWNETNIHGQSILHCAATGGNYLAVKFFLSLGADVEARDRNNNVPLHYVPAAKENFFETIRVLLEAGANINAVDNDGDDLMVNAILNGRSVEELEFIVSEGGNWKNRNKKEETVLHAAVKAGNFLALDHFIVKGLDVESKDLLGRTPLHLFEFTNENKEEVLRVLLKHKADFNACNNDGRTLVETLTLSEDVERLHTLNQVLKEFT